MTSSDHVEGPQSFSRTDAFFGLHLDLHPALHDERLGADTSQENIRALLDRVRPDFVQYDCKGHSGNTGYRTGLGNASQTIERDALGVWRAVTRERGIGLFIHYSGVFDMAACRAHSDWARVDPAGRPDPNYTSTFGPYVDELMIPQLQEVCALHDLDGVWVDGDCWAAQLDYSPAALAAWKQKTGRDDAPTGHADPDWLRWKEFNRDQFEAYVDRWVDALHAARPGIEVTSNWIYSTLFPRPVSASVDFLSGDYSAIDSVDRARVEARYLASMNLPWDLMAWGFNGPGADLKTALQLRQEAAVVLMQGGGFQMYYQPTRRGYVAEPIIEIAGEVADFCRARETISHKSTTVPQVALLFPAETYSDTVDSVGLSTGAFHALEGALHALLELHYSVDILPEFALQLRLDEYPLVVIPEATRLPDEFHEALVHYVRGGGSLLLLGASSARLFETEFGVRCDDNTREVNAILQNGVNVANVRGAWQMVQVLGREEDTEPKNSGTSIKPERTEIVAFRYPTRDTRGDKYVAATITSVGEGRIGAVYGPVADAHFRSHHPAIRALIGDLTRQLFPDPIVTVDGPPCIDVSVRRTSDGQLTVHLLNTTNAQRGDRVTVVDFIPAVGPITMRIRTNGKPKRVEWSPEDAPASWTWRDGAVEVILPSLHVHGVVVLDSGG